MTTSALITVRFSVPGFHCWPDAPFRRIYLRDKHRHLFHVEVATQVTHDDREIEFHDLMENARTLLRLEWPGFDFGANSCEMIARKLGSKLQAKHSRPFTITVSEDGECSASVRSDDH